MGEGQNITADYFDNIAAQIKQLGLNLDDLVDVVNSGVSMGLDSDSDVLPSDPDFNTPAQQVAYNAALQASAVLISVILNVTYFPNVSLVDHSHVFHSELRAHTRLEYSAWQQSGLILRR